MESNPRRVPNVSSAFAQRESGVVVAREARRHPRRAIALEARVSTLEADHDPNTQASFYILTDAQTLDVGEAGAGLRVDDDLPAGRRVMVELDLPDGSTVLTGASVMWSARDRDEYYIGLRFDEAVPDLLKRL